MRHPLARIALAAVVLLGAACGDGAAKLPLSPTDPELAIDLRADRYTRDAATGLATVTYRLGNRGDDVLFSVRCGTHFAAALDRWDGASWVELESGDCPPGVQPVAVGFGVNEVFDGTRLVGATGIFRLRLGVSHAPGGTLDFGRPSGAFEVR